MAGLDPATHGFLLLQDVNARDRPGHDEFWRAAAYYILCQKSVTSL
jgi:hypothetical protein